MITKAQGKAMGKGYAQVVYRESQKGKTTIVLEVAYHKDEYRPQAAMEAIIGALMQVDGVIEAHPGSSEIGGLQMRIATLENRLNEAKSYIRMIEGGEAPPLKAARAGGEEYVSVREAAEKLGVSVSAVHRAIRAGRIQHRSHKVQTNYSYEVLVSTFRPAMGRGKKS